MRTLAQRQSSPQERESSRVISSLPSARSTVDSLHFQSALATDTQELQAADPVTPVARFGHDLSRIPIYPIHGGTIQAKLTVNEPGDEFEQEADRVADRVMRTSTAPPRVQRRCSCGGTCDACQGHENEELRMKSAVPVHSGRTQAPPIVHKALSSPGGPLDAATRSFMEPRFGADFGSVRVHTDDLAQRSSEALRAEAFTVGRDIFFGVNRWNPSSAVGRALLAHELAHTIQQCRGTTGPGLEHRVQRKAGDERSTYPWNGRVDHTTSAALRRTPSKDPANPHVNTIADLPTGAEVWVMGSTAGWLHVQVEVDGKTLTGYVSQELVTFVSASAFQVPETITIEVRLPTVAEAFVELKRAERKKIQQGSAFHPDDDEQGRIDRAIIALQGTHKYSVDESTFQVDFVARKGQPKIQIQTVEDFILFVEQVEKQYPSATPKEVANEIRQIWRGGAKWDEMIAGHGISDKGQFVDITDKSNPLAMRFDMDQMGAPAPGGSANNLNLQTPSGLVAFDHVMSGIDATLNRLPASYEESLPQPGDSSTEREIMYDTIKEASGGGDVSDFTTWSGDIAQAYAEYIYAKYKDDDDTATLMSFAGFLNAKAPPSSSPGDKAPLTQILADIQGYIAVDVHEHVAATAASPTGKELKVSNILRNMYLADLSSAGLSSSQGEFESVSKKSGVADLKAFITERSLKMARMWFANVYKSHHGKAKIVKHTLSRTRRGMLDSLMDEFDDLHKEHEASAAYDDKLERLVDEFIRRLGSPIR